MNHDSENKVLTSKKGLERLRLFRQLCATRVTMSPVITARFNTTTARNANYYLLVAQDVGKNGKQIISFYFVESLTASSKVSTE